jgi:hypothetical protein
MNISMNMNTNTTGRNTHILIPICTNMSMTMSTNILIHMKGAAADIRIHTKGSMEPMTMFILLMKTRSMNTAIKAGVVNF